MTMAVYARVAAIGFICLILPAQLTDQQLSRLMDRMAGTWRLNVEKSVFFVGTPPSSPSGFIYSKASGNGIKWTTADGSSIQVLDGRRIQEIFPNRRWRGLQSTSS